jgi:hypothetical protein
MAFRFAHTWPLPAFGNERRGQRLPSSFALFLGALMTHTVLLLQPAAAKTTRTYYDYESIAELVDGLCHLYEQRVRAQNPGMQQVEYGLGDLNRFIDELFDCGVLTYDEATRSYKPHNKAWLKEQCYRLLKARAKPANAA